MIVVNEEMTRPSALIAYPVEFLDEVKDIYQPHVTLFYFPDVTNAEFTKQEMVNAIAESHFKRTHHLATVFGAKAFGPDKNVPVLRVGVGQQVLSHVYASIKTVLNRNNMFFDNTWGFDPHVTVDLETALTPPKQVLLRPLELWWMDDEPVKV